MKKQMIFWFYLTIQVIIVFMFGIAFSFLSESVQNSGFFGDKLLTKPYETMTGVDVYHEWGTRHYLWYWMCFTLFVLGIVRIIMWIDCFWSESNKKVYA